MEMLRLAGVMAAVAAIGLGIRAAGHQPGSPGASSSRPETAASDAPHATGLARLAFLRGVWQGKMGDDAVEETWSEPSGGSIMGMFRWQSGGKTTMYELLSITDEGGEPVLRLRHFGADFSPWKGECDGVAAMRATDIGPAHVEFTSDAASPGGLAACRYECPSADVLKIRVSFKAAERPPLEFDLARR